MGIEVDMKKLVKKIKKKLCCNGCVLDDKEYGEVIQVQGNKKDEIKTILMKVYELKDDNIKVHGC